MSVRFLDGGPLRPTMVAWSGGSRQASALDGKGLMQGKKMPGASVVTMVTATESAAQAVLRRGAATDLAPQEEKLLRMRLGAGLPLSARLERIAAATDAEIEVLAYEIEAYLRWRDGQPRAARATPTPAPAPSRVKEKIVRALRNKR